MSYNGYTNYETWAVCLWIDNEEGSYLYWKERAQEVYDESEAGKHLTRKEEASRELARELRAAHEENAPETEGVYSDLLNAALSSVNWDEVAKTRMDKIQEEEAA